MKSTFKSTLPNSQKTEKKPPTKISHKWTYFLLKYLFEKSKSKVLTLINLYLSAVGQLIMSYFNEMTFIAKVECL